MTAYVELKEKYGMIHVSTDFEQIRVVDIVEGCAIDTESVRKDLGQWKPLVGLRRQVAIERIKGDIGMTFGEAIEALKGGAKVKRKGWNGENMFIVYMPALYLPPYNTADTARKVNDRTAKWIGEDKPLDCQPYIAMYNAQEQWIPGWLASQSDMLSEDWEIA